MASSKQNCTSLCIGGGTEGGGEGGGGTLGALQFTLASKQAQDE